MKIDILCNDGSPLGVTMKSVWGEDGRVGVGGAELELLTLCEEWTRAGHEVILYNDPKYPKASPFEQRAIRSFEPTHDRDVLVIARSPNVRALGARGLKVWHSQDQYTTGNFQEFAKVVHKIVCISQFHQDYFRDKYNITGTIVIDEIIRIGDYGDCPDKIPYKFLFSSVPQRGLDIFLKVWPEILTSFPQATLVITSDYRLWGSPYALNEPYKLQAIGLKNIHFKGAIPRKQLIQEELTSDLLAYPCIYDELFCIAVAEAAVAGTYPITSAIGALRTTCNGIKIDGDPRTSAWQKIFLSRINEFLTSPDKELLRKVCQEEARKRFSPANILAQWDEKVFK